MPATLSEPRCFSIRLPRPLWISLATVLLVVVTFSLRIGVPIYGQHAAVGEIKRAGVAAIVLMTSVAGFAAEISMSNPRALAH